MMNQRELLRVGKQLLVHAKSAGATDAIASLDVNTDKKVEVRNGNLNDVTCSSSASFSITAIVGDRRGYARSSSFTKEDLARAAREAVISARAVSGNPHLRLATPDEWPCGMSELPGRYALLEKNDPSTPPTLKELERMALALDKLACRYPGVSRSEGSSFGYSSGTSVTMTSNGFEAIEPMTHYSKSVSVIAEKDGAMKSESSWHSAFHLENLRSNEECVRRAGDYAVSQLGASPVRTERMPVIFDQRISSQLLYSLFMSIDGETVYRKGTFLREHLKEQLFRDTVRIIERPHLPRSLGSRFYDDECVKTTPWVLVDGGRLMLFATTIESASKLGGCSSGHSSGPLNMLLCPTKVSRASLVRNINRGLLVTGLMGHGVNVATGDYSVGAEGFLIERGGIVRPVNKVTLAGNLLEMFRSMLPADDCSDHHYGANAPSCLIESMMVAGE